MQFIFTKQSQKQFEKLPNNIQEFIRQKLISSKENGFGDIKNLVDMEPATHRIRTGDYRLVLQKQNNDFIVLKVGHRREIYQ